MPHLSLASNADVYSIIIHHNHKQHWQPAHLASALGGLIALPVRYQKVCETKPHKSVCVMTVLCMRTLSFSTVYSSMFVLEMHKNVKTELVWTAEFSQKVWANKKAPTCMSLEEIAVRACRKVLMQVDNISLIVGHPQRILDQQLRLHQIHLPNTINYIKLNSEDFLI